MTSLDGYIRVSRVAGREGESFISPEVQRETIQKWADLHGHAINAFETDLDQSGGKIDRPGLTSILERIESGATGGIVVAKLDRLARSVADGAQLIKRIDAAGGEVASVAEGLDTASPYGRFARTILLALGELELERIRDGWATAREHAVSRGIHVSTKAPLGYLKADDGRLVPDPVMAPVVVEAFKARADGRSWRDAAEVVEAARPGHSVITPSIKHIIGNRVYLGEARSGSYVNDAGHPALVTADLFGRANANRGALPAIGRGGLLSGILRCAGCGYAMRARTSTTHGHTYFQYDCRRKHASGTCPAPAYIQQGVLDEYVTERFLSQYEGRRIRLEVERERNVESRRAVEVAAERLAAWRDDAEAQEVLGRDSWIAGLKARQEQLDAATALMADSVGSSARDDLPNVTSVRELWEHLDLAQRRAWIAEHIPVIFVKKGRQPVEERVYLAAEAPEGADLPRRGKTAPMRSYDW